MAINVTISKGTQKRKNKNGTVWNYEHGKANYIPPQFFEKLDDAEDATLVGTARVRLVNGKTILELDFDADVRVVLKKGRKNVYAKLE